MRARVRVDCHRCGRRLIDGKKQPNGLRSAHPTTLPDRPGEWLLYAECGCGTRFVVPVRRRGGGTTLDVDVWHEEPPPAVDWPSRLAKPLLQASSSPLWQQMAAEAEHRSAKRRARKSPPK